MKIGFVIDTSLDQQNFGVQQYVLQLGKWLSSEGHEVHYLTSQGSKAGLANVHNLSRILNVRFNKAKLSIPIGAKQAQVQKLLSKEKFDVLHVQMPFSPALAGRIIKSAPGDTVIVGTFHIAPSSGAVSVGTRLLGKAQRQTIKRFDQVFSVSSAAAKFAKAVYGIECTQSSNMINFAKIRGLASGHKHRGKIVYVGRLDTRKGAIYLLKALSLLKTKYPEFSVVICGDGPKRHNLNKYARENGLKSQVKFLGFVSENEKYRQLSEAEVAVFPSLGGESFGIVLIEAMAADAGVVIGGNNPGYKTVLGKWPKSLFKPKNTREFADKLHYFLTNSKEHQRLHFEQQNEIKKYDVAVVGSQLLKEYERLIASKF